jgi:hypothetical protein
MELPVALPEHPMRRDGFGIAAEPRKWYRKLESVSSYLYNQLNIDFDI